MMGTEILLSIPILIIATLLGGAIPLKWHQRLTKPAFLLIPLVAGIVISLAFGFLIPEGFTRDPVMAGFGLSIAFALVMTLEQFRAMSHARWSLSIDRLKWLSSANPSSAFQLMVAVAFLAIFIQTFILGIGISIGYTLSPLLGIGLLIGIILYKVPEGLHASWYLKKESVKESGIWSLIIGLSIVTPLALALSFLFSPLLGASGLAFILGLVAGILIYLTLVDLWDNMTGESLALPLFFVGVLPVIFLKVFQVISA